MSRSRFPAAGAHLVRSISFRSVQLGSAGSLVVACGPCALAILLLLTTLASAGDWPQILGPTRNGVAVGEKLPASFSKETVRESWSREVGSGFAGPAVVDAKLLIFHRSGNQEIIEALESDSGKPLWKNQFPTTYRATISQDDGPLCVPTVHDGKVYLFGAAGGLHCVSLADGKTVWSRDLKQDFNIAPSYFGSGSSPIVEDGKLWVNVGGRAANSGIVAFDLKTGKTMQQLGEDAGSYSSPVAATVDGTRYLIFVTRLHCVSVDPKTAKEQFRLPFGQRGPTVNGANPLVIGDHLFLTASYGIGAVWAKIDGDKTRPAWESDEVLSSQYPTPVAHEGYIYGIHGRQDIGMASLVCIDPEKISATQTEPMWTADYGMASLIVADKKLIALKTNGTLELLAATPKKFSSLGSLSVSNSTVRALPALSNGHLYFRDTEKLYSLKLGD